MTVTTYPGVYVEEVPSSVRTLVGVGTSITAFVGRSKQGPVDVPIRVQSYGDFERIFGGLWNDSEMSFGLYHYFLNGGTDAVVVRGYEPDNSTQNGIASVKLDASAEVKEVLTLEAANPGTWGNAIAIKIDHDTQDQGTKTFNLSILSTSSDGNIRREILRNLSMNASDSRFVESVVADTGILRATVHKSNIPASLDSGKAPITLVGGSDGRPLASLAGSEGARTRMYALENCDLFNLLCLPGASESDYSAAIGYCERRRALVLMDPDASWKSASLAEAGMSGYQLRHKNAAVFFPRLKMPNPLKENRLQDFAPCGAIAGVIARTDSERGLWKAPAGIGATVRGAAGPSLSLTDGENGVLNPLGLNCIRNLPAAGTVLWGARTTVGHDRLASEWKYLSVRRLALYIEESLFRGSHWAVFEPNDEPLWTQLRISVGAFMHGLFRRGAFQGAAPAEAYFVKCDKETTTQADINAGIVNIVVGFAPLKPAEFVVIKLQQMAGNIAS